MKDSMEVGAAVNERMRQEMEESGRDSTVVENLPSSKKVKLTKAGRIEAERAEAMTSLVQRYYQILSDVADHGIANLGENVQELMADLSLRDMEYFQVKTNFAGGRISSAIPLVKGAILEMIDEKRRAMRHS